MKSITQAHVVGLWSHMEQSYHSKHTSKSDSQMMRVVGYFLDAMGILNKDEFLERYTTTIGDVVYVPFKIGDTRSRYSLLSQLRTCVHEHQHVVQWRREGLGFMLRYLTSSSHRVKYEVEAMTCSLEMHWWYSKTLLDINRMAARLTDYNCSKTDIMMAKKMLDSVAKVVKRGGARTSASKTAIKYLESQGV